MMKRLFTFLFALVAFSSLAQTQVRIINEAPGIDYEFKRCICNGKSAFIDMTITNNRSKDFTNVCFEGLSLVAYDDEGNVYKNGDDSDGEHKITKVSVGANSFYPNWGAGETMGFDIPEDITLKIRISFVGVDSYATMFKRVDMVIGGAKLSLRDVPITRE